MKKDRLLALVLVVLLSVSVLPLQAFAADAGAVVNGDFSFFAGTYSAYENFVGGYGGGKPLPDLTLDADGRLSGKPTSYSSAISIKPSSVTKNSDGSYTCLKSGSLSPNGTFALGSEGYVLYPVGVAEPTYNLPTDVVRLKYVVVDGGVMEIVYHNTTALTGNGVNQPVPTAYATTQEVLIDGIPVRFETYGLKDEKGNITNYIKLRDLASRLNGTNAQFSVGWTGDGDPTGIIAVTSGGGYQNNGSEMSTPFSGDRPYGTGPSKLMVSGKVVDVEAILLKDDNGGGYTYFKLRDLGKALDFNVSWLDGKVVINTDEPYSDAN